MAGAQVAPALALEEATPLWGKPCPLGWALWALAGPGGSYSGKPSVLSDLWLLLWLRHL